MKIVVIGGSGLIGTKLVNKLRQHGHEVVAASATSGVNTLTCLSLSEALEGVAVPLWSSILPRAGAGIWKEEPL